MTQNLTDPGSENQDMTLDQQALTNISGARKWSLFLSIAGFIMIGFTFLAFLVMAFGRSFLGGIGAMEMIPALVLLLIYIIPIYYLYQFSVLSKRALATSQAYILSDAFKYLKKHYMFMGILLIIALALNVVLILLQMTMMSGF
ncbi:hypothetical protein [Marinilabilia rubra]|uniref:Uncharacterized protein n=1 Tax=Marinilabilia rubra TaxID=2162893 RepID=A0A2U2BD15_9BACT|nr:hypothetical protein [Marinilabilia rubra]PWE00950.1 hypothetical protein DDZ16_00205 [Marinilabilia rubra]